MNASTPPSVTVTDGKIVESFAVSSSGSDPSTGPGTPGQSAGATTRDLRSSWATRIVNRWWFAPVVLLVIGGVLAWSHIQVLHSLKQKLEADLQTILQADATALEVWMDSNRQSVRNIAAEPHIQDLIAKIYRANRTGIAPDDLRVLPDLATLRMDLEPLLRSHGFLGFSVVDIHYQIIASETDAPVGTALRPELQGFIDATIANETIVTPPFPSAFDFEDGQRAGDPVMYAATAVRDPVTGETIGTFALRLQPANELARILGVARPGETGDVYLFNSAGLMLTQSRFEAQLRDIGLLGADEASMLNVQLRDPQVNLALGKTPELRVAARPLTWLADRATAHVGDGTDRAGINVDGYRDYRGVMVVGAWRWLGAFNLGIALEMGVDEAWKDMLHPLRVMWMIFGLVLVFVVVSLVSSRMNLRLRSKMSEVRQENRQLGQYRLERKLGEGGMGAVYRASHALLRRPTAIKLIRTDKVTKEGVRRFEREVQMTARLTHPNTIAIFDYGHTPDGIFYYAMELLPGLTLQELVTSFGPLPPARAVHLLEQICGSLAEAHSVGLIHRDIKPGNVMLCGRGVADLIKVLDFGLVKDIAADHQDTAEQPLTQHNRVVGTPLYMSPQQLLAPDTVDELADLWSVGAVGYFLLTGKSPLQGNGVMDVIAEHMQKRVPMSMTERVPGLEVPAPLEELILACLAPETDQRPAGMLALLDQLEALDQHAAWTRHDAHDWWNYHMPHLLTGHGQDSSTGTTSSRTRMVSERLAIDLGSRRG